VETRGAAWYATYGRVVYRYLRFHVDSADTADDLTADVFFHALESEDRYDPARSEARVWIFAMARNALRDHFRRKRVRRHVTIRALRDMAADAPSAEERLLREEEIERPQPTKPGNLLSNSPLNRLRGGATIARTLGPFAYNGSFEIRKFSSSYLRGDEANQRPQIPGYTVATFESRLSINRLSVELSIDNLFNARYTQFGIEAPNSLFPPGSLIALDENSAVVVPFLTPSLPRRFTSTLGVRL
jgi:outer membrane receptor protein involved in Fe transport